MKNHVYLTACLLILFGSCASQKKTKAPADTFEESSDGTLFLGRVITIVDCHEGAIVYSQTAAPKYLVTKFVNATSDSTTLMLGEVTYAISQEERGYYLLTPTNSNVGYHLRVELQLDSILNQSQKENYLKVMKRCRWVAYKWRKRFQAARTRAAFFMAEIFAIVVLVYPTSDFSWRSDFSFVHKFFELEPDFHKFLIVFSDMLFDLV